MKKSDGFGLMGTIFGKSACGWRPILKNEGIVNECWGMT
jgi:hypothetical protein